MRTLLTALLVFCGGFAIMVLEIVGARFLAKDFGGSFYIWVSQIGVVLAALAMGYWIGGWLGDRYRKASLLAVLLLPASLFTAFVPDFSQPILDGIILRHPSDQPVPLVWQKLDPVLGSTVIFLPPCFVLATLPPFLIRFATSSVAHVGRVSGLVYAASTVGSIAGVFGSGYILIDYFSSTEIFRGTGALMAILGLLCLIPDRWMQEDSGVKD